MKINDDAVVRKGSGVENAAPMIRLLFALGGDGAVGFEFGIIVAPMTYEAASEVVT